jgi:hypothetical protein
MKLLLDEQLDGLVNYLNSEGYEVIRAKEKTPSAVDKKLVLLARAELENTKI